MKSSAIIMLTMLWGGFGLCQPLDRADQFKFSSDDYQIHLKKTTKPIILDGRLDESSWQPGKASGQFWQHFPSDSIYALGQTEMFMTFDDEYLYVATICYSKGNDFIIPSLRRDYDFFGNDNISIHFDTYNDQSNSLFFGINPLGVRREALISSGGRESGGFNDSWDNKWDGEAQIYEDHWIAEFKIPFKTLRFKAGSTQWRCNAYRFDTQHSEMSSWNRIPRNRIIMDMTYMGNVVWEEPLQKSGQNISIIPYVANAITRDFEDPSEKKPRNDFDFGGDAKIGITSGINLDLTINPDFSQVEVDQQVTNLDRFEIFFPERRQFFLENADLFGSFGNSRVNPFFSRRIGIVRDTATDDNIQNTILYGARLSGKINDRLRVGLLNMQTAKLEKNDLPRFNYIVAAGEQQVFSRSNLAFIFANKQAINSEKFSGSFNNYNRVAGLEYRMASKDNIWSGKFFHHQVFSPTAEKDKFSNMIQIQYDKRKYRFEWVNLFIGKGFDPEIGFVPRNDILLLSPEFELRFFPGRNNSKLSNHGLSIDYRSLFKTGRDEGKGLLDFEYIESQIEAEWNFNFKNTTSLDFEINYNDIHLLEDFDPTRIQEDSIFLASGTQHQFVDFGVYYSSDSRKTFSYNINPTIGQFYNGFRAGLRGSFTYRYQPLGFISVDYNFNHINLDGNFKTANLWLIGPCIDLTFTKKLFLTTFIQYNSQSDNLNINARFQWRFKPVSDFYLVYTDNYSTSPFDQFSVRNRALVAKVTYWLNL